MRKYIYAFAACLAAVACEIYPSEGNVMDSGQLCQYADTKFMETVVMPAEIIELCMDFDRYMGLTEADKEEDYRFFGKVGDLGNETYSISGVYDGDISFSVCTGGRSIMEAGVEWELGSISMNSNSYSGQFLSYHSLALPDGVSVRKHDDEASVWIVSSPGMYENRFSLVGLSDGLYEWNVAADGREDSSTGAVAEIMTGEDGMTVRERWSEGAEGKYKENIYNGQFLVNIYEGDELLDYCSLTFRPGFTTSYRTSR